MADSASGRPERIELEFDAPRNVSEVRMQTAEWMADYRAIAIDGSRPVASGRC
jgi:hypothetical protein